MTIVMSFHPALFERFFSVQIKIPEAKRSETELKPECKRQDKETISAETRILYSIPEYFVGAFIGWIYLYYLSEPHLLSHLIDRDSEMIGNWTSVHFQRKPYEKLTAVIKRMDGDSCE